MHLACAYTLIGTLPASGSDSEGALDSRARADTPPESARGVHRDSSLPLFGDRRWVSPVSPSPRQSERPVNSDGRGTRCLTRSHSAKLPAQ